MKNPSRFLGALRAFAVHSFLMGVALCLVGTVHGDVPFPARLHLTEIESGIYDVAFTLPLIEGRKLRAEPILPETCEDRSEREIGSTPGGVTTEWQVQCSPSSLAGEVILIEGLLGTQTDLAVTITTLDGRVNSTILKPSRPGFVVPPPPDVARLAMDAGLAGIRRVVRSLSIWVLLLVVVCLPTRWLPLARGVAAFAGGHVVGQWLGDQGWLLVTAPIPPLYGLLTAAVPALYLARDRSGTLGWVKPFWLSALIFGLLAGGARPDTVPSEGLSNAEQALAAIFFSVGVAFGLTLIAAAATEFRIVFFAGAEAEGRRVRVVGYLAGILAVALIVHQASAVGLTSELLPQAALALVLLAAVIGGISRQAGFGYPRVLGLFSAFVAIGLALGLSGFALPLATLMVFGVLFLLGVTIAFDRPLPAKWSILISTFSVPVFAWFVGASLIDNVSRPVGASIGAGLIALAVLHAGLGSSSGAGSAHIKWGARIVGGGAALAAVVWRLGEYREWFDETVATEAALGILRLPLLALALVILGVIFRPRRRRWEAEIGLEQPKTTSHLVLFGAAFLLLPIATIAVHNPVFEPHAPESAQARRILTRVLSNTYHAFNLDDEDELFDRLDENISADLVDDVYLDSRRRLTAGTREGAVVTVKDVSVVEIGDPLATGASDQGFSYDCMWTVTARIQHMQHIHFRHNTYSGILTIRIADDTWKIAGIELTSEVKTSVSRSAT